VNSPVRTTQYSDAELTIYDVIEADADMAEEITAGVDEARAAADGAEQLMTRLEAVYAKVEELRVPGLLAGWIIRLLDRTDTVRARALAIAANLPAAAEAISIAGANAAARHQPLADVVRDMGHTRPAEREYHEE
jgi:septation ring formation regulator EzrA